MALLKDLIVQGASRFIGDAYFNIIKGGIWNGTAINGQFGGLGKDARSLGNSTTPIYIDANGVAQTCTAYASASVASAGTAGGLSTTIANDKLPVRLQEYRTTGITDENLTVTGFYYFSTTCTQSPFLGTDYTVRKDHMLTVNGYSTAWANQIAQNFYAPEIAIRNKNNGTWSDWAYVELCKFNMTSDIKYSPYNRGFRNTRTTNAWTSQVYSRDGYVDNCVVTFKAKDTTAYVMVGLNSDPTTNANYNSIDFAWYLQSGGNLGMYESGTSVASITGHTTYAANDEFKVEYSHGYVKYYHNGVLCRSVARAISGKMYMDSSFYNGGIVYDVNFFQTESTKEDVSTSVTVNLSNTAWTEALALPGASGTYVIQLECNNTIASGMFAVRSDGDLAKDEIPLHLLSSSDSWRIYARTEGTKLKLSSTDTTETSRAVTIKIKRMI